MSAESKSGSQILQEVLNTAAASGLLPAERDEDDEDLKEFLSDVTGFGEKADVTVLAEVASTAIDVDEEDSLTQPEDELASPPKKLRPRLAKREEEDEEGEDGIGEAGADARSARVDEQLDKMEKILENFVSKMPLMEKMSKLVEGFTDYQRDIQKELQGIKAVTTEQNDKIENLTNGQQDFERKINEKMDTFERRNAAPSSTRASSDAGDLPVNQHPIAGVTLKPNTFTEKYGDKNQDGVPRASSPFVNSSFNSLNVPPDPWGSFVGKRSGNGYQARSPPPSFGSPTGAGTVIQCLTINGWPKDTPSKDVEDEVKKWLSQISDFYQSLVKRVSAAGVKATSCFIHMTYDAVEEDMWELRTALLSVLPQDHTFNIGPRKSKDEMKVDYEVSSVFKSVCALKGVHFPHKTGWLRPIKFRRNPSEILRAAAKKNC